eukprot:gb/GECH01012499.1/.p1 GENE.gb/GECH01012499.1/~~gb/GECH01012499.1/.p1  ORF type:complete len:192 (+),score=47.79 gb/GECH01012499.1/:1-576(+)
MTSSELQIIQSVIFLDEAGERIYTKYNSTFTKRKRSNKTSNLDVQKDFEKKIYQATKNHPETTEADVCTVDGHQVVFLKINNVLICVVGAFNENVVILAEVVDSLCAALNMLLKQQIERQELLTEYDLLVLLVDEMFEDGIVLELSPESIVNRVSSVSEATISGAPATVDGEPDPLVNAVSKGFQGVSFIY